jgi:ArsR family transcriptional regulator, arsenate/arsenite/antimonite-responsive transcriptional repressor
MAQSKQNLYPTEDQLTSNYAKALGHPARLKILKQLQSAGSICVQVIAQTHPISKEALSGHLKSLREAQLVEWVERFPFTFYSVNEINVKKAFDYLESFFSIFKMNE